VRNMGWLLGRGREWRDVYMQLTHIHTKTSNKYVLREGEKCFHDVYS